MSDIDTWFELMPKVELHLHLEGAIPHAALWELVQKYDGTDEVADLDALIDRFRYKSFPQFIETWIWKNAFLREYDDFSFIAEAVASDLAAQNVRYAEIFFSPSDFARHGLRTGLLAEAIRGGLDRVAPIRIQLVADLVRDFGANSAARTLVEVAEARQSGIVGIGIGGSEQNHPAHLFEAVFEDARNLGFSTSAHAGEAAGADSVWQAIDILRVDRIGHGTRAHEDPDLLRELERRSTPLEMCPTSNVCTGVVDGLSRHPIRSYFDSGLLVTVNSDDPAMFDTSLTKEYEGLSSCLGFTDEEIRSLVLNAVHASWLPASERRRLADELTRDPHWYRSSSKSN